VITSKGATPIPAAALALSVCAVRANGLLVQGRLSQPTEHRGRRVTFADGTTAAVYRETRLRCPPPPDPALIVVAFRLRLVDSERAHAAFRAESLLNTVLFVGFPGFVSKLWLHHDEAGRYRGLYQWNGADSAEVYVGSLRRVLELVSRPGSIDHRVLPGLSRDDVLRAPDLVRTDPASRDWWRPVDVRPPLP
jgi:hypothetical protein